MTTYRIWLLKLVLPLRHGRLLTGLLILSILLPVFYLGVSEAGEGSTPALFFSLIIAYIIPVFSFITARSREALLELRPILDMGEQAFAEALVRLDSASLRYILLQLGGGALLGFGHLSFIRGSVSVMLNETVTKLAGFLNTLGTLLVWVVMTTVIFMLIQQAREFARLGASEVRVSLLNTRKLVPFARVAIISSLAIIGALALFPLMSVDSEMRLAEVLPGAIATSVPLLVMFTIPVWPVHRRIRTIKERELAALNRRIEDCLGEGDGSDLETAKLEQLAPLLNYRREIAQVSTWPFDAGAVTRLSLYLIIPPLTWTGTALIENLVASYI
ncbi:MAG: hypothetical protein O7F73_00540 [Gammaproteobacteria bacterium]|nr:hypothetical protein [Gammaproteobacteria bacterium]